ncbi:MAG: hypothetical protein COB85_01585 [Bacteroidetes bacterium]|nr:MAG: hypothetical protein COB85_01585 [Bacteroidota bacterium]
MKLKRLAVCLVTLLISSETSAQWTEVNVTPNHTAKSYDFLDDNIGYASFQNMTTGLFELAKTIDGGDNWIIINPPDSAWDFKDISVPEDSVIYVVSRDLSLSVPNKSKIFKSNDDGATWIDLTPDTTNIGMGFAVVYFVDALVGYWGIADKLYKTVDGGVNWAEPNLPLGYYIQSIHFNDANNGVLGTWDGTFAYLGGVLSTNDGGITWRDTTFGTGSSTVGTVKQTSENVTYAGTAGWGSNGSLLFKTTDNGTTWTEVSIPDTLSNTMLRTFDFIDDNAGFIVEESNDTTYLYKTVDGGVSWSLNQVIDTNYLSEIHLTSNTGYLTGNLNQFFKLQSPTGIMGFSTVNSIMAYPNPSSGRFMMEIQIEEPQNMVLRILSILGEEVFVEKLNISTGLYRREFDLQDNAKGIYMLHVTTDLGVKSLKMVLD